MYYVRYTYVCLMLADTQTSTLLLSSFPLSPSGLRDS